MAARDIDVGFTVFANTQPAVQPMVKLNRTVKQTDQEMIRFGNNLKRRAQEQVRSFGATVRGASIALAGMAAALLKTAKDAGQYDRSIRLAAILTRTATEDFAEFDAGVKRISSELAILPNEVAKAGQAVGRMGFEGADAMKVLEQSVTLARASIGQLSTEQAVAAASTAIKAFGLDADDAQRVVDTMTTGVTSTALAFDKLPLAFSTASGFAASFGATLEETVAILGVTNDIITKTERAATGVRNIFRDLSLESTKLKLAQNGVNLEVIDQAGNFRGIVPILKDLFDQTEKLTEAQRLQALQNAFSQEAAGALFVIQQRLTTGFKDANGNVVTGTAGLQVFIDRLKTTGSTSALAQAQLEGLAGAFDSMKTEASLLSIEVGAALSGVLAPAITFVTGLVTGLKDSIANASPVVKTIIGVFGTAAIVLGIVGGVLIAASLAMGGWTFITGTATAANLAFLASLGPIAIALGVVVGLVVLFAKQIKFAFAQLLKFRAAVNQFFGLRGGLSEEEQQEIDELEGKTTDPETGERVDKPAADSVESIRASIAAANAPLIASRRERAATEAGGTQEEISERVGAALSGRAERAAAVGGDKETIQVTINMDSKKTGEAIIERQRRENRRTFRGT